MTLSITRPHISPAVVFITLIIQRVIEWYTMNCQFIFHLRSLGHTSIFIFLAGDASTPRISVTQKIEIVTSS